MMRIFLTLALCFSCPALASNEGWDDAKLHPTEKVRMPVQQGEGAFGFQQFETTQFRQLAFKSLDYLAARAQKEGRTACFLFIGAAHGAEPLAWLESWLKKNSSHHEIAVKEEKEEGEGKREEREIVVIVNDLYESNLVDLSNYAHHHGLSQIKTVGGDASELGKNPRFLELVDNDPRGKLTAIVASNLFHYMSPLQTFDTLVFSREWLDPKHGKIFMCQGNIHSLGWPDLNTYQTIISALKYKTEGIFSTEIFNTMCPDFDEVFWNHVKMRHFHFLNDHRLGFYFLNDDVSNHNVLKDKPVTVTTPFWVATHEKWKEIVEICGYAVETHLATTNTRTPQDSTTNIVAAPTEEFDSNSTAVRNLKFRIERYDSLVNTAYGQKKWMCGKFGDTIEIVLGFNDQGRPSFDRKEYKKTQERMAANSK